MKKINANERLKAASIEDYSPEEVKEAFSDIIRNKKTACSILSECIRNDYYNEIVSAGGSWLDMYRINEIIDHYIDFRRRYINSAKMLNNIHDEGEKGLMNFEKALNETVKELFYNTIIAFGIEKTEVEKLINNIKEFD